MTVPEVLTDQTPCDPFDDSHSFMYEILLRLPFQALPAAGGGGAEDRMDLQRDPGGAGVELVESRTPPPTRYVPTIA